MLEFLNLKSEAFGLDISNLSLKIIKLKKKGRFLTLASFDEEKIPSGIIKGGEIRDEASLTRIIKEALPKVKGEKLRTKYVIASLPEEKSFLQVIQMPRIPEEDLKSAVIYEAENYIPLPIEEVYLDSQIVRPLSNHLDHYDVLIAALPRKTVDPYLNCLKRAGILPKALEIESLAIARALMKDEVSPFPILLLDLGATRSSFIIFSDYSVRFTGSIPISSQQLTEAISRALNVDLKKAEELKIKYGLGDVKKIVPGEKTESSGTGGEAIEAKRIPETLIPSLTDLVEQIKRYLDFYQSHAFHEHLPPDGKGVKKIFLSGGGANLKGLTDFLSLELGVPVELGNPWVNILANPSGGVPQLPYSESLRWTTALGLGLRGVRQEN
jgi:type IV pilus assembly protein PilM